MEKSASLPVDLRECIHKIVSLEIHLHICYLALSLADKLQHHIQIPAFQLIEKHIGLIYETKGACLAEELFFYGGAFLAVTQKIIDSYRLVPAVKRILIQGRHIQITHHILRVGSPEA